MSAPIFSGLKSRAAGVLLHPTALPGSQGVGALGADARAFVDFLADAGVAWWQICPLGPVGPGDSPYSSPSAFAGNTLLIDLVSLRDAGLLADSDLASFRELPRDRVDFAALIPRFETVVGTLSENAKKNPSALEAFGDHGKFLRDNAHWLDDFALYSALKFRNGGKPWYEWPATDRDIRTARSRAGDPAVASRIAREKLLQFLFRAQWDALRAHAEKRGVKILGDAPIYVSLDSADAFASPELFELGDDLRPTFVAGVPPDYFSETGQLWGNPLFDWEKHKRDGYAWWISRLRANLALADGLRLDHFRAFHDYWRIPASAKDARTGEWTPGPGLPLFAAVREKLGDVLIVAEDLGDLSPGVPALREACGFPGMAVLQFAFGDTAANPYLPHNHAPNLVVYPGTHDNDTAAGWYAGLDGRTRDRFRKYFGTDGASPGWTLARAALTSPAKLAILPMQDILGLGSEARFNTPGTPSGNWSWRLSSEKFAEAREHIASLLRDLIEVTDRLGEVRNAK